MEYSTDNLPALRKFTKLCDKAGIIIWVRQPRRLKWKITLDNKLDTKKANELALQAGLEF